VTKYRGKRVLLRLGGLTQEKKSGAKERDGRERDGGERETGERERDGGEPANWYVAHALNEAAAAALESLKTSRAKADKINARRKKQKQAAQEK